MKNEIIFETIKNSLKTNNSINLDSSTKNVDEWDSLGHLSILSGLNRLFDGKIVEVEELAEAESVEEIITILKKHELY